VSAVGVSATGASGASGVEGVSSLTAGPFDGPARSPDRRRLGAGADGARSPCGSGRGDC